MTLTFFVTQALQKKLQEMAQGMSKISNRGDKLSGLVGDSEQPIISTSISGVNSEYNTLKEAWKRQYDLLQAALQETNKFQTELVKILNWLQCKATLQLEKCHLFTFTICRNLALFFIAAKEEQMASLGVVPGDTKSVKAQIENLKHFTNDVNEKYVEVEALNQQSSEMVKDRLDTEAKVIKQPMSEVNKRWKALLDSIGQRKVSSDDNSHY